MSEMLFEEARRYIAGGVNSPVRAFKSVGTPPLFIKRGEGKYIYTEDGRQLLDFCASWGPLILGHGSLVIKDAIKQALELGISFGAPTKIETAFAKLICELIPSYDKLRFVSSGTEAVMSAIRLARGYTGRPKLLKFDGCYHGHSDSLLISAGSGAGEIATSSSKGIPEEIIHNSISIPFNDTPLLTSAIEKNHQDIACAIVEPIPCNMGVVLPHHGFLETLRSLTEKYGIVLIFDEVITGFRVSLGGAQKRFGITPDMTILGKIIGGGMPVGAFGGKLEIMKYLAPEGDVYQAGTLSGNPLSMAAGFAQVNWLKNHEEVYENMEHLVDDFAYEWKKKSSLTINHFASMFTIFYTEKTVESYSDTQTQDLSLFRNYYQRALEKSCYLPPSMYEAAFVSILHDLHDCMKLIEAL